MQSRAGEKNQGLLDWLIVVIEHTRLLVIVPLAVGAITFGIAYLKPPTYTSEAILAMAEATSKQASLIMASPLVLDTVIDKFDLAKAVPLKQAREKLARQLRIKVGRDGLLRLEVGASSPAQAQLLSNTMIDAWRATTVPGEQEKEQLNARLTYVQQALKSLDQLLARLTSETPVYFGGTVTRGDHGLTLVSLGELQARYFAEAQSIPRTLQGVTRDVVRQQPSLASKPDPAGNTGMAILTAVATFLILLIAVLVKHMMDRFVHDPDNATSLARLRAALGRGKQPAPISPASLGD